ncbi:MULTISPECIES: hypothetical protein [spotted fever group]|uniref:DUF2125 domain-containing protein n=1 Tax=Rickettsia philipii (strain 364D) TaxID=481009 RepID=H6PWI7_RICP3|nr:hypothetical protein [Rickettsia philipii]AFB25890.1 hypothetical protein RSA_01430 [Rickettsia philipii str. 364D]
MIRKILLFVFLAFTIIWFATAYTIKNNVVSLIKNSESDNLKISYNVVKFSGYPFNWKITVTDPKVKLINHVNSLEFTCKNIVLNIAFSTKRAALNFGPFIREVDNYGDKTFTYDVRSDDDIKGIGKFNKPLYKISKDDNLKEILKSIQLNNKALLIFKDNQEIFKINDLAFLIRKQNLASEENISLFLNMNYYSEKDILNFKNANLDIAASLNFAEDGEDSAILQNFNIERFIFTCDNDSKINLNGDLQLFANKLPKGKLYFELENYNAIVDKLLPNNIIFSKKIIKTIIAKAINKASDVQLNTEQNDSNSAYNNITKAKFDIEFSDKGINIGAINLLELKLGEHKEDQNTTNNSN